MDINITSVAHSPLFNTGAYRSESKKVASTEPTESVKLYSVSVYSECDVHKTGVPEMLIAWGFTFKEAEISPLIDTIVAACELIYLNIKESQHANN